MSGIIHYSSNHVITQCDTIIRQLLSDKEKLGGNTEIFTSILFLCARVPVGALIKDWSSMVPVLSISFHLRTTDAETEDAFNRTNLSLRSLHTYRRNPINVMKHADRGFCNFHFSNVLVADPIVTLIGLLLLPHDDTS